MKFGVVVFPGSNCDEDLSVPKGAMGQETNIAGGTYKNKKVFGLMPHPECAADSYLANSDGKVMKVSFS